MDQDRKLRILQINKLYYPFIGGVESVVRQIAEGLNEGTEMKVLVCHEGKQTVKETVNQVKVIRAGSVAMIGNLPLSWKFLKEFQKQAKQSDILLFHMPYPMGDLAYLLSGIRDKKVILWWHSDIVRQKKWMLFYKPFMNWFLRKADRIIVATEGHINGSQYLEPYRKKCRVIPFGVRREIEEDSLNYFQKNLQKKKNEVQEKRNRKVRFLFVGRLVYYKGCDILMKAYKGLKDAELVIVGSGSLENKMKQYAQKENLSGKIYWKGNLSDRQVMEEYQNCDVLVLPSVARSEAFGLVQIEAMAYGKPVINTSLPSGVPYVSIHMKTGLTVKPGDVTELQDAMRWMIQHPKERKEMGIQARKRVEQEYLTATMMERLEKVCREKTSQEECRSCCWGDKA